MVCAVLSQAGGKAAQTCVPGFRLGHSIPGVAVFLF